MSDPAQNPHRLVAIHIDENMSAATADAEHERRVAIYDILEGNQFTIPEISRGPYELTLSISEGRLIFDIADNTHERVNMIGLSLSPFRRIVKDYFLICESYYEAIRTATPSQIETIDMARRGLHNEGSELLQERLKGKIDLDFDTARRLFTLVSALHWRG